MLAVLHSLGVTEKLVVLISTVAKLFDEADETLFHRILANNGHVLQSYLPDRSRSQYNLRTGAHSKELITKTSQPNDRDFFYTYAVQKMLLSIKLCRTRSF